ncbi:MAG: DUF3565 domain-containing protein [Acidimicrobiaceae bacterium]|nr:DUF3565 domain-containing protein [Acidimicrobiaceae bacterium]
MKRAIVAFQRDGQQWIAQLSCGHGQHVRHQPPLEVREWTIDRSGRRSRLGALLECPWCDRAELPDGLSRHDAPLTWSEQTMPEGFRVTQRLQRGHWARIIVRDGRLGATVQVKPVIDVMLETADVQAVPPDVDFSLRPLGSVRFSYELLSVAPLSTDVLGGDE